MQDASEPAAPSGDQIRVVVDLAPGSPTISGTLTGTHGSRPFWGWLELMSELERAAPPSSEDEEEE